MELINALFAFLSGNDVLVGTVNLVTLVGAGGDIVGKISKFRKVPSTSELFWSLFLGVGYKTLLTAVGKVNGIDALRIAVKKEKILKRVKLSTKDLTQMFTPVLPLQGKVICWYFDYFFTQMRQGLQELEILDENTLDQVIENAKGNVWENWTVALRETYQKYPNFRDVAIQQQFGQLELLIDGEAMPCPTCGADAHFSAPAFCNQDHKAVPYLEQNIQPFGIKKPEPEDLFPARPAAPIYDWWQKLADQLQKKPLFLTGPGGMGKTTFLKFLYDSIKSRDVNLPFSCAFLLSLDTLMREPENGLHLDIDPLYNAEDSILLRRIACLAGAPQIPGGWKNIFTHEYCFYPDRPVLLMLDGLNEMRGQAVQQKLRRYHRILDEISSLSNRANYPNICIVVTSRIDRDNLLQDQKESLKSDFEHMCLGGVQLSEEIEDAIGQYGARRETMRNFLERPMYYRAAQELLQRENLPTTQFQLINIMYDRLCVARQDF